MIYARSIACSSEGLRSKTRTRTFDKLVISSKILFLANVAAKDAITPKNSEKSCFGFFLVNLCQNNKKHKICRFWPIFSLFRNFLFHRNCPKLPKMLFWPKYSRAIAVIMAGLDFGVLP